MTGIKRHLLASTVLLGAGAVAMPASADVFVEADIFKDKDVLVFEDIQKFVFVDIFVFQEFEFENGAEAMAHVNQFTDNNFVVDAGHEINLDLTTSITGNDGVTKFNQDLGNNVNQANVVSVATDGDLATDASDGSPAFAEAQASGHQVSFGNTLFQDAVDRVATITDSINNNVGATMVNQNVGNLNNQLNELAVAVSDSAWVALSEADLGQGDPEFNYVGIDTNLFGGVSLTDTLTNSINGNVGVTTVNQTAGNFNNQATVISVSGASQL